MALRLKFLFKVLMNANTTTQCRHGNEMKRNGAIRKGEGKKRRGQERTVGDDGGGDGGEDGREAVEESEWQRNWKSMLEVISKTLTPPATHMLPPATRHPRGPVRTLEVVEREVYANSA